MNALANFQINSRLSNFSRSCNDDYSPQIEELIARTALLNLTADPEMEAYDAALERAHYSRDDGTSANEVNEEDEEVSIFNGLHGTYCVSREETNIVQTYINNIEENARKRRRYNEDDFEAIVEEDEYEEDEEDEEADEMNISVIYHEEDYATYVRATDYDSLIRLTPENAHSYIGREIMFSSRGEEIIRTILGVSNTGKSIRIDHPDLGNSLQIVSRRVFVIDRLQDQEDQEDDQGEQGDQGEQEYVYEEDQGEQEDQEDSNEEGAGTWYDNNNNYDYAESIVDDNSEIPDLVEYDDDMFHLESENARLRHENARLRQELEELGNQRRIIFPEGSCIGFVVENDVRYLYTYNSYPVSDNGPLTMDDLECGNRCSDDDMECDE